MAYFWEAGIVACPLGMSGEQHELQFPLNFLLQ